MHRNKRRCNSRRNEPIKTKKRPSPFDDGLLPICYLFNPAIIAEQAATIRLSRNIAVRQYSGFPEFFRALLAHRFLP